MAEPFLKCPSSWLKGTLEPNPKQGLIIRVDSGSTPSTTDEECWGGDIPWLTPKEITGLTDQVYISQTERTITEKGLKKTKLLPPETVMLTKRASIGAVAINAVPMCTNQGFMNFQCGEKLKPLYLAYWFKVNTKYLNMVATGSTYPELYKSDLFEFELAVPSIEEQEIIIDIVKSLEYTVNVAYALEKASKDYLKILSLQKQNRRLSLIIKKIIPNLLSGNIDISSFHYTPDSTKDLLSSNTQYLDSSLELLELSNNEWNIKENIL